MLAAAFAAVLLALVVAGCRSAVDSPAPPPEDPLGENEYAVTIAAGVKDFITAEPRRGTAGTEITLTIKSEAGFLSKLSAGQAALSRKEAGVWAFNLPQANVEVDAEFNATASADATLRSLSTSVGTLVPAFNAATKAYEIEVDNAVAAAGLDFAPNHIEATAEGERNVKVAADENTAAITVTAQDGTAKETYTVTVVRLPDAALKKVTVTGAGTQYAFTGETGAVTSDTITPYIEYAEGKDAIEVTYAAAFTKADGVDLTITSDSADFTVAGLAITGVTLKLPGGGNPMAKSARLSTQAAKEIAGKPRTAGKSYTLVLERPGDPKYPKAKMAEGGEYHIVKNSETSGDYDIVHVFTYDGAPEIIEGQGAYTFTANTAISDARVLVVAGGASGGTHNDNEYGHAGGGGGAGGLCYKDGETIPVGQYPVLIGLGGASVQPPSYNFSGTGINGKDSSFNGIVMKGGGGGAGIRCYSDNEQPRQGGSGGGGARQRPGAAALDPAYGNKGGDAAGYNTTNGSYGGHWEGGGGGGAGGAGQQGKSQDNQAVNGGRGGTGKTWADLGGIVTPALINVPDTLFGIAGGGNGAYSPGPAEDNGPGYGGGRLSYRGDRYTAQPDYNENGDALNNTGGGGGAGVLNNYSGNGGSGLVAVRYKYVQQ